MFRLFLDVNVYLSIKLPKRKKAGYFRSPLLRKRAVHHYVFIFTAAAPSIWF